MKKTLKLFFLLIFFLLIQKISNAQPNDSTNNVFEQLVLNKHWVLDTFNYDGQDTIPYPDDSALWALGDFEFKLVHGKRYHKYFYNDTLILFDSTDTDWEWDFDTSGTKLKGVIGMFANDNNSSIGMTFTLIGPQEVNDVVLLTTDKLWLRQVDYQNKTILAKFRKK